VRDDDTVSGDEAVRRARSGGPEAKLKVLISGAGIGGCTLAYWLARNGHSVTVVERSGSLRSSGSPVDVRGAAVDVAERMNILAQLREARIRLQGMTLLDAAGQRVARVDIDVLRSAIVPKDLEIARGDSPGSSMAPAQTTPTTSSAIPSRRSARMKREWM
jgi:glycine/D-amino acid oxidase-like deaminating enzyme